MESNQTRYGLTNKRQEATRSVKKTSRTYFLLIISILLIYIYFDIIKYILQFSLVFLIKKGQILQKQKVKKLRV